MSYLMGIDQGGTKTDVIIADRHGHIAGYGNDRDWTPVSGERRAVRMIRVRHAAEKALADAGLQMGDVKTVSASCNGADWEFEYAIGEKNLRNTLGIEDVTLYNDCIGALRGGTEMMGKDCAVICLGTGANCAVINREGRQYIYHYYMKDIHQGAGAIGRFVFQSVFDARAGLAPPTLLTRLLLEETGYGSVDELLTVITTGRREDEPVWRPVYKEYCPLLFRAIDQGDQVAAQYLEWLCKELANYVIIAAKELGMENRAFPVVLSGGVPKSGSLMSELLLKHLRASLPGVHCVNARLEPVVGALLLGYDKLCGGSIPPAVLEALERDCGERRLFRPLFNEGEGMEA